jgi:hypothetical protein
MACSCDSCSSPRIIKTRTVLFWRWLAQSRGQTADRVIPAPVRAVTASVRDGLTDDYPWDVAEKSVNCRGLCTSCIGSDASSDMNGGDRHE